MNVFDPTYIDPDQLQDDASKLLLLLDALKQKEHSLVMLKRLWPMVKELRESLEPLEAEHKKWAVKHYSAERRLAEVRKQVIKPHSVGKRKEVPSQEMTDEQAEKFITSQSRNQRLKLAEDLRKMMEE